MFLNNYLEGNIGEAIRHKEKLCNEVEMEREFTYLGGRVNVGEGYETAITVRTIIWWVNFGECDN